MEFNVKNIFLGFIFIVCSVVAVNVFAQGSPPSPTCTGSTVKIYCTANSNHIHSCPVDSHPVFTNRCVYGSKSGDQFSCKKGCSCPEGWSYQSTVDSEGNATSGCVADAVDDCEYGADANGVCYPPDCPFGDGTPEACSNNSSSSSSAPPVCVPPYYNDPVTGQCVTDDGDGSSSSSAASEGSGGDSSSGGGSSSGNDSSSGDGGDNGGGGSSSPSGNPVPTDSTCPNKFQIGDQWFCQSNPMPSSEGSASSDGSNAAAAGTCGAAPVCDGDPVGCAILLNAHFHRCNTDKKSSGGGDCSSEPACEGDPVGCSVVLQTWKFRCDSGGEDLNPDSDLDQYNSDFESQFGDDKQAPLDGDGALSSLAEMSNVVDFDSVDMSGLNISSTGRSAQCPSSRSIRLAVGSYEVSFQPLCDFAEQISPLVVLIFSYMSGLLVWRSTQQG